MNTTNIFTEGVIKIEGEQKLNKGLSQINRNALSSNKKNKIALIGDSITYFNGNGDFQVYSTDGGDFYTKQGKGFYNVGNALLGQPFELPSGWNFGVSGETTTEILARIQSVIDVNPDYVHILGGSNDNMALETSVDTAFNNLKAMCDLCSEFGITTLVGTVLPRVGASSGIIENIQSINKKLKDYCMTKTNVVCIDYFSILADKETLLPRTSEAVFYDNVHPNSYGGYLMGEVFKEYVAPLVYNNRRFNYGESVENVLPNPNFNGDTAGVATSWVFTGAGTPSKVSSDDLYDDDYQQLLQDTEYGVLSEVINIGSGLEVGDSFYGEVEQEITNITTYRRAYLEIRVTDAGGTVITTADLFVNNNDVQVTPNVLGTIKQTLRTPAVTIPEGALTVQFRLIADGAFTIKYRRAGLFKV